MRRNSCRRKSSRTPRLPESNLRPGIQQISEGLYQSALAHVLPGWEAIRPYVDFIALLATPAEPLPSDVPVIVFPIEDNAEGAERFGQVSQLAQMLAPYRVLTVCHMGENRSGLLSALILYWRGETPTQAVANVMLNGPHNSPTQQTSFWNPGFQRQVRALPHPHA